MLLQKKKRYLISALIFLFLLIGTGAGFFLLKNSQDVRQQASGCKPGEPYCSCNLNGQDCVLVDPDGPRAIVEQGSQENLKGVLATSFTGERPTTSSACGGVWMNNFCYMPGDEIAGGFVVVESGRYNYPYLEKKATHDSLAFGAETVSNQIGTVQSLGKDCGGKGYLIGNNCYAFGAVVNGYIVMPNRTGNCDNSTGDYCYAHLKPIEVSYNDWQAAVSQYETTGDFAQLEKLYKDTYGISFEPGQLFDSNAENADLLRAQALIASLTNAEVLKENAEKENIALLKESGGNLTAEQQATYDFNQQIIESENLDKRYQLLDQLNSATSQKLTINNAVSQMYSDLVVADGEANLDNLAREKFKEIFGYDPGNKYGDLNGILGAFGIDPAQLNKDRDSYTQTVQKQTEATNELNQEYQDYVSGKSENINDLKQAAIDAGLITENDIRGKSETELLALLLSKFSDTSSTQATQNATAIVNSRTEQELTAKYMDNRGEDTSSEDLLALYKLYVGSSPRYRMTTQELENEIAKHNSQFALSLYAETQDVSYLNNYYTSNFNAPDTQLTRVLGDPKALLNSIYGEAGNELYQDIVLPNRLNSAIANFSNDAGTSLTSVCKELGVTNCNINSTNATTTLSLMLDKIYGGRTDVNVSIPDLATSYSNQIFADSKDAVVDASLDKAGSMMAYSNVSNSNASFALGQWLGNLLMGKKDESVSDLMAANVEPFLESYHEADQSLIIARQAVDTFNASQAFNYATENRSDLSDYTWGLSYGNVLMSDNIFNREFTIDEMDLNVGQTVSLTFNQLSSQIANVDVAQNIATNYATSKYYDYTGPADTRIADIALRGANNIVLDSGSKLLDYDYQAAQSGYYTAKTLNSWGESIGQAATYVGALYAASQMNQTALNQSMYLGDNNFELVDPVTYAEEVSAEFKVDRHQQTIDNLYLNYVANAEKNNVDQISFEQFIDDPEIQRSSQELNYERLEKVVAPAAAIVALPIMVASGVGVPIILGAASSAFSLYQGAGMKAQALEIQRIDIESRENAIVQSYMENGASEAEIADLKLSLDEQVETLNKQGNLMLANSAVAALTSAGGLLNTAAGAASSVNTASLLANSGQVLTKAGQIGGIAMNSYNAVNSGISSYEAFSQGNIGGGIMSGLSSFIAASGVAGNTFGVFGPTTYTNKIDYVLDAMNVPAGAAVDAQQVAQACFGSSDAFSQKDCTNAWIGLALSAGQNVSQISSSYKSYRNDMEVNRITDIQKQIDAIDLEILALNGPNKGISAGLQINDLALQRARLVDQVADINPNIKVASANSTEDYLAAGMRISLDLETKAQAAIDAGQDAQAMRLIEQAEIFRNKPVEASALRDQISAIDDQVSKKGLFLSTDELTDLQQNRNDLVNKLETVVKDLSSIESMQKQNDIILQTVKADTAFQELNRLLAVDTQKAELVKIYTPDTEVVTKYISELTDVGSTPKLETDSNKRLISLEALQSNLSKITELESNRQALVNSSNADSEAVKTEISKLDAEISSVRSMVDGVSVDKRTIFRKFTDLFSPNKTNNNAYYKSLELTREAESLKAKLADSSLGETDTRNLKNQLAEVNRQLIDQKYLLAQDAANPSKNVIQRAAELIPNIIVNRQISNLKNAAKKLGTANLEIAENIISKQAELNKLREQGVLNETETSRVAELEAEITDLSKTASNLLKGNNALISVGEENGFTKYIVTETGKDAGIKQEHLNILNKELASFEDFRRQSQTTEEIDKYGPFKIYSGTDSFKDQDIFLLAEIEAFGAGRRGTVFGALPGMGKTDVVMPFNILLKQRLTNQPQFVVFPEAKLMKPWTSDSDYTPNKEFIDYVESNFGPGSVVIVKANDTSIDPAVLAKAKFVITTKDVAFDLQNTGTQAGLALRNKWRNSFVHADEVDWTFNPNENYKLSGEQVALRDKPEFDLYLNAQKNVLGIDEQGNLSGKGLSSLRNLINQLETSKSIPDGIIRTSDGKGGKFADADLEKQVLSEWLGTWGGQNKIPDLDMSADIAIVREKINTYLSTDTDAQTHNHRAELAMINETVNFLSRVPGEDYGLSSNTRMNGDAEEIINSIAPKEQNKDTGRSYSAVAESLLYNTLGAKVLGVNNQVDISKLTVGEGGSEINYALLMLESKGFSLYTGTPETVAKLYKMAYGIELKVFTDSAVDDSIARFKNSDSAVFTDLESQIASRLTENRDQVFVNMVSGLRSNEVALRDLVTKISAVDIETADQQQVYKKLILVGASGKLTEYDLVGGDLQYVRDFPTTDDLNTRTAELNKDGQRYIKFYEYGAHVGVDTANDVNISRAVGLCSGCDATTFAQGINRLRVQVIDDPSNVGKKMTSSAPMDVVWLDAPASRTNLNIDDFAVAINNRQAINEALAEVSFKETLLRNSVDATFADLVELARNGKKGFLGLGAYRANQDLVAQLEVAQQKWKETTQMNYMLGSDDLSAQAKLEKTASQVAGAYEELNRLLVGSGEPAKLLATRADGAIGNNRLSLAFSGDDNYKVLGERPSYRQIVELINQSSKHLENVDIAFTNRSSQTEVVQSEMAKAAEVQAEAVVKNNERSVSQNIFQRTAQIINQNINSQVVQKIVRTPVALFSSAYSAIVNLFNGEEIAPEILAQRDKAISDLKITDEQTLGDLENLKTAEEINNFVAARQLAYQQLKDQFAAINTNKPAINNEEDYRNQSEKFTENLRIIQDLQEKSGLAFVEIDENGVIQRVNKDQFSNFSTFRAKAELQAEKLAKAAESKKIEDEKLAQEQAEKDRQAQEEAKKLALEEARLLAEQKQKEEEQKAKEEAEKLEQEKLAKEEAERLAAEQAKKEAAEKLAQAEKLKQEEEQAALELAKVKEAEELAAANEAQKAQEVQKAQESVNATDEDQFNIKKVTSFFAVQFNALKDNLSNLFNQNNAKVIETIGRNKNNSLKISAGLTTVSRNHAELIKLKNNLYIRDLNSANGTYVNGIRIGSDENYILFENDVVFLGNPDYTGVTFTVARNNKDQLYLKTNSPNLLVADNSIFNRDNLIAEQPIGSSQEDVLEKLKTRSAVLNLNQSELNFFNQAKTDVKQSKLARDLLNKKEFVPKRKVIIEGITYYFLTDIVKTNNGSGYLQVIMYSIDSNNRIIPRSLYKSNSDGGWRSAPYFANGIYSKGNGVVYTQETKVHDQLNSLLNEMENKGSIVLMNEDLIKDYFNVGVVIDNNLNNFADEVKIHDDKGLLSDLQKYPPGSYNKETSTPNIEDVSNLGYPDGFIPDFNEGPFLTEEVNHTLLGSTTLRKYLGVLNNRPVVWVMATDKSDRVWIDRIYFADSKLTSYGVYDEIINSGILTNKPLEYISQAYYLDSSYKKPYNDKYVDITPMLANLLPIQQYRASLQHSQQNKYQELVDKIAVFVDDYKIETEEDYDWALNAYNKILPSTLELQKHSGAVFIEENNGVLQRNADWIGKSYEDFFAYAVKELASNLLNQSKFHGQADFSITFDNDQLGEIFQDNGFDALKTTIQEQIKQKEDIYLAGGIIDQANEFMNNFARLQDSNQLTNIPYNQISEYLHKASLLIDILQNQDLEAHNLYDQIKQASKKLNSLLSIKNLNKGLTKKAELSLASLVGIAQKQGLDLLNPTKLELFFKALLQRPNSNQEIANIIRIAESNKTNIRENLENITLNIEEVQQAVPVELFEGSDGYKLISRAATNNNDVAMNFYKTLRSDVFSLILSEEGLAFNEDNTEQYLEKIASLNNWTEYIKNHFQTTLDENEKQNAIALVNKAFVEDLLWIRREKFDEILFSSLFIDKPFFDGLLLAGDINVAHAYDTFGQSTRTGDIGAWDSWVNAYDYNLSELNFENLRNLHKTIFAWYDDPDTNPSKKNDRAGVLRDPNDPRDREPLYAKDYQDGSPLVLTQSQIDNLNNLRSLRDGVDEPIMKFVFADGVTGPNENGLYVGYIEFCKAVDIEQELGALMKWHTEEISKPHDPYLLAAELQQRFIAIHPFRDGNGRTSRWLMNWSLKKDGVESSIIYDTDGDMFTSVQDWAEELRKGETRFKSLKNQAISMIERGIPSKMMIPQIEVEGTENWSFHEWTQFLTFVRSNSELSINKLAIGNKLNRNEFYSAIKDAVVSFYLYQITSVKPDFGGLIDPYYAMSYANTNPRVQEFLRKNYASGELVRRGVYNKLDLKNRFTKPEDLLSFFHGGQDDLITTNGVHKAVTARLYEEIQGKNLLEQRSIIGNYLSGQVGDHKYGTSGSKFTQDFPDLIVNTSITSELIDEIIETLIDSKGLKVPGYFAKHAAEIYNYIMLDVFNSKESSVTKQVVSGHIGADSWWHVSPFTSYSKNYTTPKNFSIEHLSDGNVNAAFVVTSALPTVGALYDTDYDGVYSFQRAGVGSGYNHEGEVLLAGGQNLSLIEKIEMWVKDTSDGANHLLSTVERFGVNGNSLRLIIYDKNGSIIKSEIHRFDENGILNLVNVINGDELNNFTNLQSEISEIKSLISQLNLGDSEAKFDSYTGQSLTIPITIDENGYNTINPVEFHEFKKKLQLILKYRTYLLNNGIYIGLTDNPSFAETEKRFKEVLEKAGIKYEPLDSSSDVQNNSPRKSFELITDLENGIKNGDWVEELFSDTSSHPIRKFRNTNSGLTVLAKKAPKHTIRTDFISTLILSSSGLPSPKVEIVKLNGDEYLVSEYIDNAKSGNTNKFPNNFTDHRLVQKAFLFDLLTMNYDRNAENILFSENGKEVVFIDNAAGLGSSARGEYRDFPDELTEDQIAQIMTLALNDNLVVNPAYAEIIDFEILKKEGRVVIKDIDLMKELLSDFTKLSNDTLTEIVEKAFSNKAHEEMVKEILERKWFVENYLAANPKSRYAPATIKYFNKILNEFNGNEKNYLLHALQARRNSIINYFSQMLNLPENGFNSLCSDCNQVRLATQIGVEKADNLIKESESLFQRAEEAKNNNDANKAEDLTTQAETKKQEALKQLNDTRFQVVNSHGMQNQCVQLYLNAWVDTREALIRKTRADVDNAIDSVYKATVLAEKMMDSKQMEIKTNTIFGLGGEISYQPLSGEEVDDIGDLLFGNENKNIEGLQSWATFDLGADGKFSRTVLKGSLLDLDNTIVTNQVSPIRIFLRKFAISSRQMIVLENLKTTLSSYFIEQDEDQPDISVTPTITITVSPTPSVTPTLEPVSPTPSVETASSNESNLDWRFILNVIGTVLSLTLFGSILGHLPIFATPELPEQTPTAIVEEIQVIQEAEKTEEQPVIYPETTSTPTISPEETSLPVLTPTSVEAVRNLEQEEIAEQEKEEIVFFNQLDDRWKNIQIDKNTKFGNVGCGVVSVANLTGVSPEQVLKFYEIGSAMGITVNGTGIEANAAALEILGYETSTGVNGNGVLENEIRMANSRNDYGELVEDLNNYQEIGGWQVMLNGNFGNLGGGGHWVVVEEINIEENTITVIDPNGGELKEYVFDISGNSGNDNAITPKRILLAKKA